MSKINELKELNKQQQLIVSLGKQPTSQYYQNITKQVVDTKQVPYIEKERYTELEKKTTQESYQELEPYTDLEAKTRYITKWRTEKYYENQDQWETVTRYKTETYQVQEVAGNRSGAIHLLTLSIGTFGKALFNGGDPWYYDTVTKTRQVPYEERVKKTITAEKTRQVSYQVPETYYEHARKEKLVTKYRDVTKYEKVKKERDVVKYRDQNVYKNVTEKKFDESKYNNDLNKIKYKAGQLKQSLLGECEHLFEQGWEAENDEREDRSAQAEELFQKGLQVSLELQQITPDDPAIKACLEKFTSKIEGNKNFNLGLNLEKIGNNLLKEAQTLEAKGKYSQAKEKYSIALKYFTQGNKHDLRFKENIDFVQEKITELNDHLKEISSNNNFTLDVNFNTQEQNDCQMPESGGVKYFEHI